MNKIRVATTWLDGCSGCHMSLLDMDQRLIDLADKIDLVYGPFVDLKEFPENVDLTLVEGAISSEEDLEKIHLIRQRTKTLLSLGDCALTANVPSMRNPFPVDSVIDRAYGENSENPGVLPSSAVPKLLKQARPVHEFVKVDVCVPGCPPDADVIHFTITEILNGRVPDLSTLTRFGA